MDFNLRVDPGALVNLSNVKQATTGVHVTDSELAVDFGMDFTARINRSAIAGVEEVPDPRPAVFFPMGVTSAVDRLGRDTVCVITSYDGLVKVDFNREVEAEGRPIQPARNPLSRGGDTHDYSPPAAWMTLLRVVGVIVAIVLIIQGLMHGLGLLVLIAIVLIILFFIGRALMSSMQARTNQRSAVVLERASIPFRHLIVSVDDPQGLVRELTQRGGVSTAARPVR